ncbi:MAG: WbqC family protein [Anaerohalosphaeraceae bacterium]|jgi:hypothetical protein
MKIGIMQPYLFPYIGYYQLINAVDLFVIYDNIQFTKKGWLNRNRILSSGRDKLFTLPLKKDSDFLNVCERSIANSYPKDRDRLIHRIHNAYHQSPMYDRVFPVIESCFFCKDVNLFRFLLNSIVTVTDYLQIKTEILISSEIDIDHSLKGQDKVLSICKKLGGTFYLNPIGGIELYNKTVFKQSGIELAFLKTLDIIYPQLGNAFVPNLSIIDVMMFNSPEKINDYLKMYQLV